MLSETTESWELWSCSVNASVKGAEAGAGMTMLKLRSVRYFVVWFKSVNISVLHF